MSEEAKCRSCEWWSGPMWHGAVARQCRCPKVVDVGGTDNDAKPDEVVIYNTEDAFEGAVFCCGPDFGCVHYSKG